MTNEQYTHLISLLERILTAVSMSDRERNYRATKHLYNDKLECFVCGNPTQLCCCRQAKGGQ